MWWKYLLEIITVFIIVYLLDKLRAKTDNSFLRSFLDFVNGLLNCLLVYLGILLLAELNWLKPLKGGVSKAVHLLGDNLLGTVTMTVAVTLLYIALWKYILFKYVFFAGSNVMNLLLSGAISICFILLRFADGIDGAPGFWSVICGILCGFIAFLGLLRVMSALNVNRCPECHTYFVDILHSEESYAGSDSETSWKTDRDYRTESSSNEFREIRTYNTSRVTDYYDVYAKQHKCSVCGCEWSTHRKIHTGSDSTPYEKEEDTTTYKW